MLRTTEVCPVCDARRTLWEGEAFPNHPDLRFAARGRLRWCAYSHGQIVPIVGVGA